MEFQYQAINSQGQPLSGVISAGSEREAARLLRQQGLTPLGIEPTIQKIIAGRGKKLASTQEKALVVRELATLLQAGVPLAEAVGSIGEAHGETAIGGAFTAIHKALRGGESLARAMQGVNLTLPDYLHQLVAAGEITGKLAHSLNSAANQMEYEERIRQEMRNALIYPAILVFSGIAATLLVFIVVVPKFAGLIKSGHADIPALSRWVIGMGLFVKQHLLWVGLGVLGVVLGLLILLGNAAARRKLYEGLAKMPVLGVWLLETEIGRWASMFGTLLENRVPIVTAMELAQNGLRLSATQGQMQQAVRDVRAGKKLADALASTGVLNSTGLNLIRVGERSGELAPMLRALAVLHEDAGRNRMKRFLLLLEPIAILIIGSVIGTIMIAIMLAITSMSNITF